MCFWNTWIIGTELREIAAFDVPCAKSVLCLTHRKKRSSVDSDETVVSESNKGADDVFEDAVETASVSDKSSVKTDSSSLHGNFQDDPTDAEFRSDLGFPRVSAVEH